jgi:hypothetical protein
MTVSENVKYLKPKHMIGLCETAVRRYPRNWRLGNGVRVEQVPCGKPATWRYTRAADNISAEFCDECTSHLKPRTPTDAGRWTEITPKEAT